MLAEMRKFLDYDGDLCDVLSPKLAIDLAKTSLQVYDKMKKVLDDMRRLLNEAD